MKLSPVFNALKLVPGLSVAAATFGLAVHMMTPDTAQASAGPDVNDGASHSQSVKDGPYDSAKIFDIIEDADQGSFLSFGKVMDPIISQAAWHKYAKDYPDDYGMTAEEPLSVPAEQIPDLKKLNEDYYSNFTYISDEDQYGVEEDIRPAAPMDDVHADLRQKVADDCDGYGLGLMIQANEKLGIDFSSMSLVIVDPHVPGDDSLHALLMIRTEKGDLLLNNDGNTKFANEYPDFTFLQAQALTRKDTWESISLNPVGVDPAMEELPDYTEEASNTPDVASVFPAPYPSFRR